ncbi:MAG: Ig-like domain-containing protein [Bacteroidaceae bacterium]|nr:Ig-like domain-containing protein [Bacteroidaceae bacterium]
MKSITLNPSSSNGTTPFTFSTTSDKISLSTASGTSCTVTGLAATGDDDAVVVIGQAAGTHAGTNYLAATPINVNVSVVDNRTTPSITFSDDNVDLTTGDDQTVTVTTTHTGTRSVTSSDDDIASVEMSSGNVYVLAGDKGGTATITLSIAENGDYKAASNSFTVTVDDGKSDPTINLSSNEIGINAVKTFTVSSNSAGAITVSTDNANAVLDDNGDGTFDLTSDVVGTVTVNISQAANGSYRAYNTTKDISVVDNRSVPTFAFSAASKEVEWDDRGDYVKPTLTNGSDQTATYTSSNTSVATVASNGDITFVAGGETTITASVSGSATYKDAEASYVLTVNKPFEFSETFNNASVSGSTFNNADNTGWSISTAYAESAGVDDTKCARIASGSAGGSITTPVLTGIPTNSKMTLQAKSYGSDTGVSLSFSGTDCTVSPTSASITNSYATYTVYITKTGDSPKVTISASTKGKRAYVDNISITDLPNATITIANVEVKEGATANATVTTNNETGAFTFTSSDDDVATVAKVGDDYVVTGVAEGTATITARQAGNTYYKTTTTTFTVTVISASTVMNPTLSAADGATVEISDNITITAETGCTIKYTTDGTDPKVSGTATSVDANTANVVVPTGVNSLTLKAVAKNGENFSEVVTAAYTVVKKTLTASFDADGIEVAIGADADEPALTNPSGGAVTWESDDTDVVTVNSAGQLTAIAAGTATITATIAATDTYLGGSASYEVTVYDPAIIEVDFTNNVFALESNKQEASYELSYKGVTFAFNKGTNNSNSPRIDGGATSPKYARLYTGNTMTLTAPTGYTISKIVFDFNKGSLTNSDNTYKSSATTWTGLESPVVFTGAESTFLNKMTITLTAIESVTVTSASYATYASSNALDFTGKSIKAYIAKTKGDGTGVTFEQVNKVPANTGVLLYKDGGATESIPVLSGDADDVTGNVFKVGTGAAVASVDGNLHNYILNVVNDVIGFYKAAGQTVATNRAYIQIDESAGVKAFFALPGMEDTPTGIEAVESSQTTVDSKEIYNLAGQRVDNSQFTIHNSQLKRGIYIVNGRKVLVK